ncbi:hypothetical protein DFQ27_000071 [Actinomortierella ambigua]|uniref:Uncharacterized protein n=1 Tax=Actinomortierella ambigua TaxID=1343610 RepID=A0A9P6QLA8_9FUNG|nr:hypothetical protein DFQ27_000071 [Actinomortierella ambigua]
MSSEPLQHPLLPTTTSRPEPAPTSLLTKGEAKRSSAALEPEFVDSNDINGLAPSSAILRADYLVIDDNQILVDKSDRTLDITALSSDAATLSSQQHAQQPPVKRLKVSIDQPQPSAADLAALGDKNAVIQPALSFSRLTKTSPPSLAFSPSNTTYSPISNAIPQDPLLPQPTQEENQAHAPSLRQRQGSFSRGRMVAQLAPPVNQNQPFVGDERKIARTIGDPIDTTRATVPMSIYPDPGPPSASMMPMIGGGGSRRKASLRPGKDISIEKLDTWHDDVTMTAGGPFGTKGTATATTTTTAATTSPQNIDPDSDVIMTDAPPASSSPSATTATTIGLAESSSTVSPPLSDTTTTSSHATKERPVMLGKTRRPSASFTMSAIHPFGQPKKGALASSKHVRIQILDDAETAKIRQETEQAQREQDLSIQHEIELEDERKAEEELLMMEAGKTKITYDHKNRISNNNSSSSNHKSRIHQDDEVALPIEDPVTHDWDREELDDDGGGGSGGSGGGNSGSSSGRPSGDVKDDSENPRSQRAMTAADSSARSSRLKRRRALEEDSGEIDEEADDDDDDDDDDYDDTDNDPEQDLPAMSEIQEEETHNCHVRLETQMDFQLTAGLDRGELDANAYDEVGRYIGSIEQDDEGASEYENR